jgi:hypothetical protein
VTHIEIGTGNIIHAEGEFFGIGGGAGDVIHAAGVQVFPSSAPKGAHRKVGRKTYRMGVIRSTFWRRY